MKKLLTVVFAAMVFGVFGESFEDELNLVEKWINATYKPGSLAHQSASQKLLNIFTHTCGFECQKSRYRYHKMSTIYCQDILLHQVSEAIQNIVISPTPFVFYSLHLLADWKVTFLFSEQPPLICILSITIPQLYRYWWFC